VIFAFFGHPGAGKTTLTLRFAGLHGIPGIDTDRFMTTAERAAVPVGRYTQAMRLDNIRRYCEHLHATVPPGGHAALADGLPNEEARRFLLAQFPPGEAVLVLVHTERSLWERWLAARAGNPVAVGLAERPLVRCVGELGKSTSHIYAPRRRASPFSTDSGAVWRASVVR